MTIPPLRGGQHADPPPWTDPRSNVTLGPPTVVTGTRFDPDKDPMPEYAGPAPRSDEGEIHTDRCHSARCPCYLDGWLLRSEIAANIGPLPTWVCEECSAPWPNGDAPQCHRCGNRTRVPASTPGPDHQLQPGEPALDLLEPHPPTWRQRLWEWRTRRRATHRIRLSEKTAPQPRPNPSDPIPPEPRISKRATIEPRAFTASATCPACGTTYAEGDLIDTGENAPAIARYTAQRWKLTEGDRRTIYPFPPRCPCRTGQPPDITITQTHPQTD